MSCHNIGYALNEIVKHVLSVYDSGNIKKEVAKSIIDKCRESVGYCDGNSDEALKCFEEQVRCSCCLEKVKDIELYSYGKEPEIVSKVMENEWLGEYTVGLTICRGCLKETFDRKLRKS